MNPTAETLKAKARAVRIEDEVARLAEEPTAAAASRKRLTRSSAEFVAAFVPQEYVFDGILQRRFVYSFTGRTSAGKTAVLLLIAAHVALGRPVGDRSVEKGRVLYFAGENDVDVQMRWIAMSRQTDFDVEDIDVRFIPGRLKISEMMEHISTEIEATGELTLVLVDTSAAYFEGSDENDNKQAGTHARMLRGLTDLPGGPCVVVACHPPKNAGTDNLQPRGGGAFIAEMDGNLTAEKTDSAVELHWQGKFRGPDFAPISFQLRTVTHERLKTTKGRLIPTVVARHLSEAAQQAIEKTQRSHEDAMLKVVAAHPTASLAELANLLGWRMQDGGPYKMRVKRVLKTLEKAKLIKMERDGNMLTPAGEKALKAAQ